MLMGFHETRTGITAMTTTNTTSTPRRLARLWPFPAVLGLTLGLGACGTDTELNGKIFDLMGVSSAAQAASGVQMEGSRLGC